MGLLPSRVTLVKVFLFLGIFGSMMMWRRLQLASCQEKRFTQHVTHTAFFSNVTKHLRGGNDASTLLDYENEIGNAGLSKKEKKELFSEGKFNSNDHIWNSDEVLFKLSDNTRTELLMTLSVKADQNRTVIISIVDSTLMEFALNFYILSLQKHSITNYVFICLDPMSQDYLQKHGISCMLFTLPDMSTLIQSRSRFGSESVENGDFGSKQYYTNTNVKTLFVLETLKLNYNVLLSDVDIIFFKYPFKYLTCNGCDIMVSMDREYWNSGFVYVMSTERSILLYTRAWKLYNHYHLSHDQAYLNMAHKLMVQDRLALKAVELSSRLFPCGHFYFREDFREFYSDQPCTDCVIVHNNYMGSSAGKKYRLQENLLWSVDTDGYYSSSDTKYLTYENPLDFGSQTYDAELNALKSALMLGLVLNRVVILPKFHCCACKTKKCSKSKHKCSLLHVIKVKAFEEAFKGQYREASFLQHPLVPSAIKSSNIAHLRLSAKEKTSPVSTNTVDFGYSDLKDTNIFTVDNSTKSEDFQVWIENFQKEPILFFESLYVNLTTLLTPSEVERFRSLAEGAFVCTEYEQWEVKPFV